MDVLEYTRAAADRPWRWGDVDCTLFCADWVMVTTGRDPGAGLRGTYQTRDAANAIVAAAGGMAGFVGSRLEPLGFHRVQRPQDGDIGIIEVPTGFEDDEIIVKAIPAICFGPLWAVRGARGAALKRVTWTGVAWRIA